MRDKSSKQSKLSCVYCINNSFFTLYHTTGESSTGTVANAIQEGDGLAISSPNDGWRTQDGILPR